MRVFGAVVLPLPDVTVRQYLNEAPTAWSTSQGSAYYPYVHSLGGVSLFDFRDFDPAQYSNVFPNSTWREFVTYRSEWREAVWIEIDVSQLGGAFISGAAVPARWNAGRVGNIMPKIEVAHLGPLPCAAFREAFLVREGVDTLSPIVFSC